MVDRVNIGIDSADEPVSFFQGQKTVSESVYKSSNVDFYSTSLGMPDLAEDTGISVDDDLTELKQFTPDVSTSNDDDDNGPPDILSGKTLSGEYGFTPTIYDGGAPSVLGGTTFNTYSDYLNSNKKTDRVFSFDSSLAQNVIEPLVDGDFSNIQFGKQVSGSVKRGVKDIKAAPGKAKSMFDRLVDGELTTRDNQKIAGGVMSVLGGLPGAAAAGFIGGETVTNAFGNASFRPGGVLGAVADTVHTLQYKIAASNRAYTNSLSQYGSLAGTDTGFAMLTSSNFGVMREHGSSSYTGNYGGLSREHIVALDRLSQGNDPTRGYDITKANTGTNIEGNGGVFVSNNRIDGFYRSNGTFYNPRTNQSAAGGTMSNVDQLAAKTFGVSDVNYKAGTGQVYRNAVRNALEVARAGTMTLNEALDLEKAKITGPAQSTETSRQQPSSVITMRPLAAEPDSGGYAAAAQASAQRQSEREDKQSDTVGGGGTRGGSSRSGDFSGNQTGRGSGPTDGGFGGTGRGRSGYNDGGLVGYAPGGAVAQGGSGFIDRPPEQVSEAQSVADNRPDAVPEGTFVINAPAVEFAGSNDIKKMLIDAHKEAIRRGITVDKDGKGAKLIDVALSSGEVKVAPHLAKIIGYDRLNKINNRGKPEVEERIEENGQQIVGAATGGLMLGLRQEPQTQLPEGFIQQPSTVDAGPIPSRDEDTFFNYSIGQIKDAIKGVEIKGFEDQPYIFTGIKRKTAPSSAFGPMQITADTLQDLKDRGPEYKRLSSETKAYIDELIQQGKDKVNLEKRGSIFRNKKRVTTPEELKSKLGRYGMGVIPIETHQQYYDIVADAVLRQKLRDHDNLDAALASYGEGKPYADKVKKGLQ